MAKQIDSSWIRGLDYCQGYMAVYTDRGALLYGPAKAGDPGVPSWIPGLLTAGMDKGGERSSGRAFNRIFKKQVRGLAYQRVAPERVAELRAMMRKLREQAS